MIHDEADKNDSARNYWNQQLVYMRHMGQDEYEDIFSEFFKAGWDARKSAELRRMINEPQPFGSVLPSYVGIDWSGMPGKLTMNGLVLTPEEIQKIKEAVPRLNI